MPTLSHSQIELWTQCAAKWRYLKIDRLQEAPSEALILGTAVHAAIEADMRRRARGVRQSPDQTHLMALAAFSHALADELAQRDPAGVLTAVKRETMRRRGQAIMRAYATGAAPRLYPMAGAVEEPFAVDVPDAPGWQFTGRMDARTRVGERAPVIVDFKSGRAWDVGAEHHKPQASAYLWADSQRRVAVPAESVAFVTLPDTTAEDGITVTATVDIRVTRRTPEQVAAYASHVAQVARAIERAREHNDFPARTGPLCAWCGVRNACQPGTAWVAAHPAMAARAGLVVAPAATATAEQTAEQTA